MQIRELCEIIRERLDTMHVGCFKDEVRPLLLISEQYPGVWLEHVYDSVFYATLDRTKLYLAVNTLELFMRRQTEDGQLPCCIIDGNKRKEGPLVSYSQIQECVSFARLGLMVYRMGGDKELLGRCYSTAERWVGWLRKNRMTRGEGLVEMFVGFDTGHDNSGRLNGISCRGTQIIDGVRLNAAVLPPEDGITPIIAVDMNSNYYSTLMSLSEMAAELSYETEGYWRDEVAKVKKRLIELTYDEKDAFFYDLDKQGRRRKYLSSAVLHLFMEGVLDPICDREMISEIITRHLMNPNEFRTPYAYPSMAVCDPSCEGHIASNCWGYFTEGLILLRTTLWMDKYGLGDELDRMCESWLRAWCEHYDEIKLGQELDPITGVPSPSSEWYSSTMLFYLYAAKRLGYYDGI